MQRPTKSKRDIRIATLCTVLGALGWNCAKTHYVPQAAAHAGHGAVAGRSASAGSAGSAGMDGGSIAQGGAGANTDGAGGKGGDGVGGAPASGAGGVGGNAGSAASQPRTCADAWYHCRDACVAIALAGGGRSFGQCTGECSFELTMSSAIPLEGNGDCVAISVSLVVHTTDGRLLSFSSTLSEQAWEQLAGISRALQGVALAPMTGCPDCADGGTASVTLRAGDGSTQDYSYGYGKPPQPLRDADAFIQALIDQMRACKGPLLATCSASISTSDPDAPAGTGSYCTFTYEKPQDRSAVQCSFPVGIDAPCREAVRCLCSSDAFDPGRVDLQACVDSWLAPRGAPTFADFCASDTASATRSLSEALSDFAQTYKATVNAAPECGKVRAYY